MNRSTIERVMAKLNALRGRTQKQHGDAFAVTLFQRCIGVDIQFNDVRVEASRNRRNGNAHLVAQVAIGAYHQRQNGRWVHRPL